jgi:hypothetical protein
MAAYPPPSWSPGPLAPKARAAAAKAAPKGKAHPGLTITAPPAAPAARSALTVRRRRRDLVSQRRVERIIRVSPCRRIRPARLETSRRSDTAGTSSFLWPRARDTRSLGTSAGASFWNWIRCSRNVDGSLWLGGRRRFCGDLSRSRSSIDGLRVRALPACPNSLTLTATGVIA